MLDEADLKRLADAFPDLMLTPARVQVAMTDTAIAMLIATMGLAAAATYVLMRPVWR